MSATEAHTPSYFHGTGYLGRAPVGKGQAPLGFRADLLRGVAVGDRAGISLLSGLAAAFFTTGLAGLFFSAGALAPTLSATFYTSG